jgi:DNA-directed RNA polymerase subunit K/omega
MKVPITRKSSSRPDIFECIHVVNVKRCIIRARRNIDVKKKLKETKAVGQGYEEVEDEVVEMTIRKEPELQEEEKRNKL